MKKQANILFRALSFVERLAARMQGKGYGSATIEKEIACIVKLMKHEPSCAFDIGGNVGSYTQELCRRWPNITVHVFEPSPTNLPKLENRFGLRKNIHIHPFAVSDFEGTTTLFADQPGSGMGSLSHRNLTHLGISEFNNEEQVRVVRGEDYWKQLGGGKVDIIKLDIEGHELSAIKGLGAIVEQTSIFQFEFGGCNIDTRTYFKDFFDFFKDNNFEIYRITPFGVELISNYRETDEFFSTTNFLALNKR
jgi:FkbM family methyltransferase